MAIDALSDSLLNSVQFSVPRGHLLAYNSANVERFSIVAKGAELEQGSTSNLKAISDRISSLFNQIELGQLDAKAKIYLAANIDLFNLLIEKYNGKISQNRWLNFLDYLVWILTFGHRQITCKSLDKHKYDEIIKGISNRKEYFDVFSKDSKLIDFSNNMKLDFTDRLKYVKYATLTKEESTAILQLAKVSNLNQLRSRPLMNLFTMAYQQDDEKQLAVDLLHIWELKFTIHPLDYSDLDFFDCFSTSPYDRYNSVNMGHAKINNGLAQQKLTDYLKELSVETLKKLSTSPLLNAYRDIKDAIITATGQHLELIKILHDAKAPN